MIVEKEVTIYVEYFIDALEIVDKMNISLHHAVIFMDEESFFEGKCHVIIDKTLFIFLPVAYKLFKTKKPESKYTYHLKDKEEDKMESLMEKYKEEKK